MKTRGLLFLVFIVPFLAAEGPTFEAASLKPAPDQASANRITRFSGGPGRKDPGRIRYSNVSLQQFLMEAWDLREYQVIGPGWITSRLFNLDATMPAGTSKQDFMLMLQGLVTERFSLKLREEQRAVGGYSLTVAKGGPKLAQGGKSALNAATNKDGFPPGIIPIGSFQNLHFPTGARLAGLQVSLDEFSRALAAELKAAVVDETGLSGRYDIALYFSPDSASAVPPPDSATNAPVATPEPQSEQDIFGAIQKQLGLRLQGGKTNQKVLVVTYANQTPKDN